MLFRRLLLIIIIITALCGTGAFATDARAEVLTGEEVVLEKGEDVEVHGATLR